MQKKYTQSVAPTRDYAVLSPMMTNTTAVASRISSASFQAQPEKLQVSYPVILSPGSSPGDFSFNAGPSLKETCCTIETETLSLTGVDFLSP